MRRRRRRSSATCRRRGNCNDRESDVSRQENGLDTRVRLDLSMPFRSVAAVSQKTISIVTGCYNEEENVLNLYNQVREVMVGIGRDEYEHIFIDNSSKDNTVAILKAIAAQDKNVKIIVNARNFGHIRSPIHGLFQARGDAVISIVADLQDPPPMIAEMIREWENGAYCV